MHNVVLPDGGSVWFSAAISPYTEDSVVIVARDITELRNARDELERRVEERTRDLQTVLDVSRNVASTLELRPLLRMFIDQVRQVADYNRSSIFLVEGDDLVMFSSRVGGEDQQPHAACASRSRTSSRCGARSATARRASSMTSSATPTRRSLTAACSREVIDALLRDPLLDGRAAGR